jgi:polysaccharide export outer membrane protein
MANKSGMHKLVPAIFFNFFYIMLFLFKFTSMQRLSRWGLGGLVVMCIGFSLLFSSCASVKKSVYFSNLTDTVGVAEPLVLPVMKYIDPVILPNDNLYIALQTMAQNETNTPISSSTVTMFNPLNGFLVDKNGMIELSLIGFVKVGGLTTAEARELIKEKAKEYYKEPVVNVRISNFSVAFLGEFGNHGNINFPNEKVSIFEAVAEAGDILLTGRKDNLLLIRSEGDTRKLVRFNLNSSEVFKSPYFYMRQRDVLYAEPTRYRIQTSDNTITRNVSIISGLLSLLTVFLAFRNFK